jgi:rhamnosyltransferase
MQNIPTVMALEKARALSVADLSADLAAPQVAILLAARNGMAWIEAQLDSILKQTGVRTTIYIGVDPSTDGTLAWCQAMAAQNPAVKVLPFNGHSGGAASNFFRLIATVDFSAFDYVSLADQDDIWLPSKLARAHEVLSKTGADGYSSNVIAFWDDGRKVLVKKSQRQVKWDFLFEAAGPGCTYVMRRGLAQAVQSLVRSRPKDLAGLGLHDWFIYAFARAHGWRWLIDEEAGMLYRQHASNLVGVNAGAQAFRYRARQALGVGAVTA